MPHLPSLTPFQRLLDAIDFKKVQKRAGVPQPHKLAMLLAALDYARSTPDWDGTIPTSSEVEARFNLYQRLLRPKGAPVSMANPFHYLQNSHFWVLVPRDSSDAKIRPTGFMETYRRRVSHALVREFMWPLFTDVDRNLDVSIRLIDHWFMEVSKDIGVVAGEL